MTDTMLSKLSTTRAGARRRIWLQGSRLPDNGFRHGSKFRKEWSKGKLVLTPLALDEFNSTPVAGRGSIAGDIKRPVIDITGKMVADTFNGDEVRVTYHAGRIVITNA